MQVHSCPCLSPGVLLLLFVGVAQALGPQLCPWDMGKGSRVKSWWAPEWWQGEGRVQLSHKPRPRVPPGPLVPQEGGKSFLSLLQQRGR